MARIPTQTRKEKGKEEWKDEWEKSNQKNHKRKDTTPSGRERIAEFGSGWHPKRNKARGGNGPERIEGTSIIANIPQPMPQVSAKRPTRPHTLLLRKTHIQNYISYPTS